MTNPHQKSQRMNDPIRAEQLAKVDALLYAPCDEEWIAETVCIEGDGWIEAGVMMKPYVEYLKSRTPEQIRAQFRQMRIQSILLPELHGRLQTWELGMSFEAVHLDALVAEDDQHLPMEERTLRSQVVALLSNLFTEEDWQTLADIAAQGASKGVLQLAQKKIVPPVAV